MVDSSSMWHAGAVRGLARFLRNEGLRPDAHHGGNVRLRHGSCSWYGASQHPGPSWRISIGRRPHGNVACDPQLLHFRGSKLRCPQQVETWVCIEQKIWASHGQDFVLLVNVPEPHQGSLVEFCWVTFNLFCCNDRSRVFNFSSLINSWPTRDSRASSSPSVLDEVCFQHLAARKPTHDSANHVLINNTLSVPKFSLSVSSAAPSVQTELSCS